MRVTADAERHIRSGHPWVYDQSIRSLSHPGQPGDLAVVFDKRRDFLAIGLFDPDSPIRIKVLHHGRPLQIDQQFWVGRIREAVELRQSLETDPDTTAYRLINGENDWLPGLIVDRYGSSLVIKIYSSAWFPHLDAVMKALTHLLAPERIVLRLARNVAKGETFGCHDGLVLRGEPVTGPVGFLENGLAFEADLVHGQKTGHFLDQRENRGQVKLLAKGMTVLDVFSCTGGFSLAAAAGGATRVHATDLAPRAIDSVVANMAANDHIEAVARCQLTTSVGDAFGEMERLATSGQRFDLVIVDPPSFAQKQQDIGRAQRAYRRLTSLALALVADGGVLVQSSCSSRLSAERFFDGVGEAARLNGFRLEVLDQTEHALDHPATFPEGSYLKTIFARPIRSHPRRDQSRPIAVRS